MAAARAIPIRIGGETPGDLVVGGVGIEALQSLEAEAAIGQMVRDPLPLLGRHLADVEIGQLLLAGTLQHPFRTVSDRHRRPSHSLVVIPVGERIRLPRTL